MNIKDVSRLTGVSVRALRHYDEIELLRPARNPENGYREYGEAELDRLQQVLFFKACGFGLAGVKALLDTPSFDRERAFAFQKKHLLRERSRIDAMLATLEKTIATARGETTMTAEEKFAGFDFSRNPYEEEARRLWGDEAVDKSNARVAALPEQEKHALGQQMDGIFTSLAALRDQPPASPEVQEAIGGLYRYFRNFGCEYSPEAFAGLGQLYITDARFTENIDRYGSGLSAFLAEAMGIYAETMARLEQ